MPEGITDNQPQQLRNAATIIYNCIKKSTKIYELAQRATSDSVAATVTYDEVSGKIVQLASEAIDSFVNANGSALELESQIKQAITSAVMQLLANGDKNDINVKTLKSILKLLDERLGIKYSLPKEL